MGFRIGRVLKNILCIGMFALSSVAAAESASTFTAVTSSSSTSKDSDDTGVVYKAPLPKKTDSDSETITVTTTTTTTGSASGASSAGSCASLQEELSACSSAAAQAVTSCNSDNNSSLQSAMSTASQASASSNSSQGVSTSCSNMGMLGATASLALGSFKSSCSSAKESCVAACNSAKASAVQCGSADSASYREASAGSTQCSAFQAKIDQAGSAMSSLNSEVEKARNCEQQLAAANTPSDDPNSAYCKAHPSVASCILDCNHPSMLNNKTCICMANSLAEGCSSSKASGGNIVSTSTNEATVTKSAAPATAAGEPTAAAAVAVKKINSSAAEASSGPSLRLANTTWSDGRANSVRGDKNSALDSGIRGGEKSSSQGDENEGGGKGWTTPNADKTAEEKNKQVGGFNSLTKDNKGGPEAPDLRQFLPGGLRAARRGIAGIGNEIGIDGISGANETNWEKMQRRYHLLESTFLP